jgi:type II secretory pathway pseudopilin PulG
LYQTKAHLSLRRARRPRGFSIVEAMVALSITAMAGAVLLLAVESTVQTTTDSVERTIADGLAQQLLDEALTRRFVAAGGDPLSAAFGPSALEQAGTGRERYDDSDDYHGISAIPAKDEFGKAIGTGNDKGGLRHASFQVPSGFPQNWRQRVNVYFVNATDHRQKLTSGTSYYRAIEVFIDVRDGDGTYRTLASRKRVIAYVPPASS